MDPSAPPPNNPNFQEGRPAQIPTAPAPETKSPPPYSGGEAYPYPQQGQQQAYLQQGAPQEPYPQQQAAYPQQQPPAGYIEAQAPYPQQQQYPPSTYPAQQPAYPPQQQGYPQQQTAYPLNAPPPYYPETQRAPPPPQQQTSANVVVVQQQPQVIRTGPVYRSNSAANSANTLALILTITFGVFFCWWALLCTIPAIIFASNAQSASNRGDEAAAKSNTNISFGCSIAAIVFVVVIPIVFFGAIYGSAASR